MPRTALTIPERFWSKVDRRGPGECWEWTGARSGDGYGRFYMAGAQHNAHRVAWERGRGPIPAGLYVCHRCDNPSCVNPDHLFLGTQSDNMRDCVAKNRHVPSYWHLGQTHCFRGHEFTPENTRLSRRGGRACKTCSRELERQWRAKHPTANRDYKRAYNQRQRERRHQLATSIATWRTKSDHAARVNLTE